MMACGQGAPWKRTALALVPMRHGERAEPKSPHMKIGDRTKSSVKQASHLQNTQIMPVPEQVGKTFFGDTVSF
jgi:hypothetical protein